MIGPLRTNSVRFRLFVPCSILDLETKLRDMNRRHLTVALMACVGFSMALIFTRVAEARCRRPNVSVSVVRGARGSTLTVSGQYFWEVCHDTDDLIGVPMTGAKNIRILLKQGDRSTLLTTLDADSDLRFSTIVEIPKNAELGRATFVAVANAYALYERLEERPNPVEFEVLASD